MPRITWDDTAKRFYEHGVEMGVLYIPTAGVYDAGYAWNGLVNVTQSPSGAEVSKYYANNRLYASLTSVEEWSGSIEAYTYPPEFAALNGEHTAVAGLTVGQQSRGVFGLCYRTIVGNDVDGDDHGYKLHLVYGLRVSPTEKNAQTKGDAPEPGTMSWEVTSDPVSVTGFDQPTSVLTVDSRTAPATELAALEAILYGDSADPELPDPDTVITTLTPA